MITYIEIQENAACRSAAFFSCGKGAEPGETMARLGVLGHSGALCESGHAPVSVEPGGGGGGPRNAVCRVCESAHAAVFEKPGVSGGGRKWSTGEKGRRWICEKNPCGRLIRAVRRDVRREDGQKWKD